MKKNPIKVRYSHHHVWRRADAEWVNWQSLAPKMSGMPNRYLENLSVVQRACLGFPPPGNSYQLRAIVLPYRYVIQILSYPCLLGSLGRAHSPE